MNANNNNNFTILSNVYKFRHTYSGLPKIYWRDPLEALSSTRADVPPMRKPILVTMTQKINIFRISRFKNQFRSTTNYHALTSWFPDHYSLVSHIVLTTRNWLYFYPGQVSFTGSSPRIHPSLLDRLKLFEIFNSTGFRVSSEF